ncbi:MAG: VOC family protein, partial [Polyangiaceae bacterium]
MATKFTHGRFVWRELATTEPKKAVAFYSELFGWKIKETEMGGGAKYYLIDAGDKQVAGIWPAEKGMPTFWGAYVSVADVDATAKKATAAGGKVMREPMDIPNVGRFAVIVDPQGAVSMPFKSAHGDQEPGQPKQGEFCWESLQTTSTKAAVDFYTKVYGWEVKE